MKTKQEICRFCFKMCCNFETIDGDIKDVSDVVLPGIDLAAIRKPVMCTHCEKILFMCFDFKARCLDTHDYLVPFANKKDDGVKLKLKDVYMTKNKNNVPEDQDVCGFCMCPVKNCFAIFVDVGERDVMLRKTLKQCLPELDLSIIEKPVICAPCHASLEVHSRFVTKVLNGEEKIRKYKESLGINSKNHIDLSSLGQSILGEVGGNGGDVTELEKMFDNHSESVDKEVERKCNIDDLKFNNEQNFTPTNMLDCKIEENEIGAIKIEETFCAEDGTEVKKENIVEVEDPKMLMDEEIEIKPDEFDFKRFEDDIAMTRLNTRFNVKQECPIMPKFEENLLELNADQTCVNKNITKTTYLYERGPLKKENKYHLKTHLQKHKDISEVTMYTCDSCAYQTKLKAVLKRHLLIHKDMSEVTMYKCDSCAYQTIHKSTLKRHLLKHKNPSEVAMHKCNSCAYQTVWKCALKTHVLGHKHISEVEMYKCDLCSYQAKQKQHLKRHSIMHKNPSEVTMYRCDSCEFQTIHRGSIKTHSLKHKDIPDVKMYTCDA